MSTIRLHTNVYRVMISEPVDCCACIEKFMGSLCSHFSFVKVYHCQRRSSQLEKINDMPLYPTEKVGVAVLYDNGSSYHVCLSTGNLG